MIQNNVINQSWYLLPSIENQNWDLIIDTQLKKFPCQTLYSTSSAIDQARVQYLNAFLQSGYIFVTNPKDNHTFWFPLISIYGITEHRQIRSFHYVIVQTKHEKYFRFSWAINTYKLFLSISAFFISGITSSLKKYVR